MQPQDLPLNAFTFLKLFLIFSQHTAASPTMAAAPTTASSTASSHLPLTTTFTPPYECLNDLWILQSAWSGTISNWGNLGPDNTTQCLPSGWASSSYFSPGIVCPSGFTMDPERTTVTSGRTRGTCCPIYTPSSWTFTPRTSGVEWKQWHRFEKCVYDPTSDISYAFSHTNNEPTSVEISEGRLSSGQPGFNAYGVALEWQATDLSSSSPTPTTTSTASSSEESSGLSTGAKAGVGVGVALGAILAILAVGFLILRRRKNHQGQDRGKDGHDIASAPYMRQEQQHELSATDPVPRYKDHELDSNPIFEAESCQRGPPRRREPAELE